VKLPIGRLLAVLVFGAVCSGASLSTGAARLEPPSMAVVISHDTDPYVAALDGFRDSLTRQGLPPEIKTYQLGGDLAGAYPILDEIVQQEPDLILTLGSLATRWVLDQKLESPIISGLILDSSVLEGRENSTGVVLEIPIEVQIHWISQVLPEQKTIGVLYNPRQNSERVRAAAVAAARLGMRLVAKEVTEPRELPAALSALSRRVDVLWGIPDSVVLTRETTRSVLLFSFRNRIPFVGLSTAWVEAGALYSLERNYEDLGAQCAEKAVEVLRGKPVLSIPISTPRTVSLALNTRTIDHMKIDVPVSIVRGAETLVE